MVISRYDDDDDALVVVGCKYKKHTLRVFSTKGLVDGLSGLAVKVLLLLLLLLCASLV